MTSAVLLAACAGTLLAAGLCDAAQLVAERRAIARARATTTDPAACARPTPTPTPASRAAAALARFGRRLGAPNAPRDLGARLAAAGLTGRLRPADAMAIKAGCGAAAVLATAPVLASLPLRLMVLAGPLTGAAGFLALDLHLARRAQRRTERARVELADVLDLLRVAVAAGLPTGRALTEVGRHRGGLVAAELRALSQRLALGAPRADALAELRLRLPLPALATLVAAIDRADRHGASLAPTLLALAEEARADRARALHDQAARSAPRIQLAIALLLVPAVLLLVAAGLVHSLA
ncbi:type II secretion system F family protein [Baekduia sp. Peel2402]|uniref:type II secretion system F family protein n=1 Tax=Baekduia sp. Peel2402 TaxID=3458296 RepID=UPI00403E3F45